MDVYGCMEHEDNVTDSADSVLTDYTGCYRTLGIKDFEVLGQESPVQMDCYHRARCWLCPGQSLPGKWKTKGCGFAQHCSKFNLMQLEKM